MAASIRNINHVHNTINRTAFSQKYCKLVFRSCCFQAPLFRNSFATSLCSAHQSMLKWIQCMILGSMLSILVRRLSMFLHFTVHLWQYTPRRLPRSYKILHDLPRSYKILTRLANSSVPGGCLSEFVLRERPLQLAKLTSRNIRNFSNIKNCSNAFGT